MYRLGSKKRLPARIVSVNYHPPNDSQNNNAGTSATETQTTKVSESPQQNGVITKASLKPTKSKSPNKKEFFI